MQKKGLDKIQHPYMIKKKNLKKNKNKNKQTKKSQKIKNKVGLPWWSSG